MTIRKTLALLAALTSLAITQSHPAFAEDGSDADKIRQLFMNSSYDKPEARTTVDPIVVQDDVAIAGWSNGELGGRALLRRKDGNWSFVFCAGDALKQSTTLESAGVEKPTADALEAKLSLAERAVAPARLAQFSRFDGIVMTDSAGNHIPADPHNGPLPSGQGP